MDSPTRRLVSPLLLLLVAATALFAMSVGSVDIPATDILTRLRDLALGGGGMDVEDRILLEVRLPRVLLSLSVGAALAIAGLAAQVLFRNPLASPSVIGVSNGAALGSVAGVLLATRFGAQPGPVVACGSVAAGLLATALVFAMGRRSTSFGHALLLAGIAIGALCSSLTTAALYLAGERLNSIVFWLMGGLWQANRLSAAVMVALAVAGILLMRRWARELNVALLGDRSARDLGLDLHRLQRRLLVLTAVLASVAVSLTGVIAFVGLVVPHLMRLAVGADHRRLVLPVAAGGAVLLTVADTAARTLAAPAEIPVGVFTALLGAPVFLWLLDRHRSAGLP